MRSTSIFNAVACASSALLAGAAPAQLSARDGLYVPANGETQTPSCGTFADEQKWGIASVPWIKDVSKAGGKFCATKWQDGHVIRGLAAFKESWDGKCDGKGAITRLEIRYSSDDTVVLGTGNKACPAGSIGMDPDETISYIASWKAGDRPDAQGKIEIKTKQNGQDKQDVFLKDEYNKDDYGNKYEPNVGGGILTALTGYLVNDVITEIDFHFIPGTLNKVYTNGFEYDQEALKKIKIDRKAIFSHTFVNGDPDNKGTYGLSDTTRVQETVHTESEKTTTMGVTVSMSEEVGIRGIVQVGLSQEFTWSEVNRALNTTDTTHEQAVAWNMSGPINPSTAMVCQVYTGVVTGTIPYTANTTMEFNTAHDGTKSYVYKVNGKIDAQELTGEAGVTDCTPRPMNSTDVPSPPSEVSIIPDSHSSTSSASSTSPSSKPTKPASSSADSTATSDSPDPTDAATSDPAQSSDPIDTDAAEPTEPAKTSSSAKKSASTTAHKTSSSVTDDSTQETDAPESSSAKKTSGTAKKTSSVTDDAPEVTDAPESTSSVKKATSSAINKTSSSVQDDASDATDVPASTSSSKKATSAAIKTSSSVSDDAPEVTPAPSTSSSKKAISTTKTTSSVDDTPDKNPAAKPSKSSASDAAASSDSAPTSTTLKTTTSKVTPTKTPTKATTTLKPTKTTAKSHKTNVAAAEVALPDDTDADSAAASS